MPDVEHVSVANDTTDSNAIVATTATTTSGGSTTPARFTNTPSVRSVMAYTALERKQKLALHVLMVMVLVSGCNSAIT
jgi:hypothetical protein